MSWLRAVSNSGDDVFDENGDDLLLQSKEWVSSMRKRVRDGYVDGADAGEEASLSVGFKVGFREGAAQTVVVGRLKGIVSAIWCWCQIEHPEKPVPASVMELLQQVSQHEDTIKDRIKFALENPPPSVSDVSESMEELEVEQADPGACGKECNTDCCRKGDKVDLLSHCRPQKLCSGPSDSFSNQAENLNNLLQRCVDLVSELGLPQELTSHIQELWNIQ